MDLEMHPDIYVQRGEEMQGRCQQAHGLKPRWLKRDLDAYLRSSDTRVCILYGLRRTGKTTLMEQAAWDFEQERPGCAAFITINRNPTCGMLDLYRAINLLMDQGVSLFFIDEITAIEDFAQESSYLVDRDSYAPKGCKFVLAGADSLSFSYAEMDAMYGRTMDLMTTCISHEEWSDVTGCDDVDRYLQYAGAFLGHCDWPCFSVRPARPGSEAWRYVDAAISFNIIRSTENFEDGRCMGILRDIADADQSYGVLRACIERVVRSIACAPIVEMVENETKACEPMKAKARLSLAAETMKQIVKSPAGEAFGGVTVTESHVRAIQSYLLEIDAARRIDGIGAGDAGRETYVLTQPFLCSACADEMIRQLMADDDMACLPMRTREAVMTKVREVAREHSLAGISL